MEKRRQLRWLAALMIVVSTYAIVDLFMSSYAANPDPKARYEIQAVRIESDRSFHWIEIHLTKAGSLDHDLSLPVILVTEQSKEHEPADTKFAGTPGKGLTDIWFKFWLSDKDLKSRICLEINGSSLRVKDNTGIPKNTNQVFRSSNWNTSWLGF